MEIRSPLQLQLEWGDWNKLAEVGSARSAPSSPGIYRISHSRTSGLEYIGYGDLCERIYRLNLGIESEKMPYRDPHIASPCLWAINKELEGEFWVSWIPEPDVNEEELTGKKAALLAQYRLTTGQSPTANFGRMIDGYTPSTDYFGGMRGMKTDSPVSGSLVGNPPNDWDKWDNVCSDSWIGYNWSSFEPLIPDWTNPSLIKDNLPSESGIVRIREAGKDYLVEIGCAQNIRKSVFELREKKERDDLEISYTVKESEKSWNRYEIESDLIGVHYMAKQLIPESDDKDEKESWVNQLIERGESERVEFKEKVPNNGRKLTKDMIALANNAGGTLLIGVKDNGELDGVEDIQGAREDVSDFATSNNIEPGLTFSMDSISINGNDILIIEIRQAEIPTGQNGVFYYRDGPSSNPMSGMRMLEFVENKDEL